MSCIYPNHDYGSNLLEEQLNRCESDIMDSCNLNPSYERIFWLYFLITIFFSIIGVGMILWNNDNAWSLTIFWLISNFALLIIIYIASINIWFKDNINWWIINVIFLILLILSVVWAVEFNDVTIRTTIGVLILFATLILYSFARTNESNDFLDTENPSYILWIIVGYLIIWTSLTLYSVIL